jgi:hypothetical protein
LQRITHPDTFFFSARSPMVVQVAVFLARFDLTMAAKGELKREAGARSRLR